MKILYQWLREFVDVALPPAELAERLTLCGLEVESLTRLDQGPAGIVAGKILSVEPHPNADRLSLCRVSDGTREITVVCGAPNVRAGESAPLALPGMRLPDGTVLKKTKLRGIASEGMLCSERELGLGEDAAGIMLLGAGVPAGATLSAALGLDDWLLDISVSPNRPDCLSVIGIAREVSALLDIPLVVPAPRVDERGGPAAGRVSIAVERPDLCPRYTARFVSGVGHPTAPFRIRRRLGLSGVRAVSAVVDATNYVMLERGQPLHAFDAAKVRGGAVAVRAAVGGERIVTIDGKERALPPGIPVIADEEGPIAVAGVMGGLESGVGPGTTEILLESACFNPAAVRRASKALGLSTDSSYRFERGTDIEGTIPALDSAAQLIAEIAGGRVCAGVIERASIPPARRAIALRAARLDAVLGPGIPLAEAAACLERLGNRCRQSGGGALAVEPPSFRVDLRGEIDLVEEIARMRGYERISASDPSAAAPDAAGSGRGRARSIARDALCAMGFSEAVTLSFMGAADMERLMWGPDDPRRAAVAIRNPVNEELSLLRTTLLPSMMRCLGLNASRGAHDARFFELGAVFLPAARGGPPVERERLALAATGLSSPSNWCAAGREADYFFLKGALESLLERGGPALGVERAARGGFHPGRCASLFLGGEEWGCLGEIHPRVAEAYGLRGRAVFAEVDAGPLLELLSSPARHRALPRFPAVRRDVAVVADAGAEAARLIACIRAAGPGLVETVTLFDLFTGAQIAAGKKGLAFSVRLRPKDGTLTDAQIAGAMERIREALRGEGCEIR
jgi:phenylalanyl-tRNA synthetase beta chain